MVLGIVFASIFAAIFIAAIVVGLYFTISLVKTPMIEVNYKKHFIKVGITVCAAMIAFIASSLFFYQILKVTPSAQYVVQLILGGLLFSGCLLTAVHFFIIHYYGHNLPEKLDKWLFRIQIIGFTAAVFFFFIWTNGFAHYLTYPIPSGINFQHGFVAPGATDKDGYPIGPNIAFYAICILSGAILVYFLCDHYMYKEYGKHGILESTFFVAFPAGIIGGRIGYVVGNWHEFAGHFVDAFAIWKGGLTILAGAPAGIIVGVIWYLWRNRDKSLWVIFDIALPAILIAQAIGRWGNFFNCEVHGLAVNAENWKWLPEIIWRNSQFDQSGSFAGDGQIYLPLFFIEGVINLLGYFVLAHVFGKALRKYVEFGDVGFGYIIWYGMTRVVLEPLRDGAYQMGTKGYWSWLWSMAFVIAGTLMIVINHFVRNYLKKKNCTFNVKPYDKKLGLIASLVILAVGGAIIAVAAYLMTSNKFETIVAYNGFNTGAILLVTGISVLLCLAISIPIFVEAIRGKQHA